MQLIMKMSKLPIFFCFAILFCISDSGFSQPYSHRNLTRGADTSEIYLLCFWYKDQNTLWSGIFRSTDNGKTISVQRKMNYWEEGGSIYGDPEPGALFQIPYRGGGDTLGISYDYGRTFQGKFFQGICASSAGGSSGEVYIGGYGLYRSSDFGSTFTQKSNIDSLKLQEVGLIPGEVFAYKWPYINGPLGLEFSHDSGTSFTLSFLTFPGIPLFEECDIHRGTQPGELYFFVWKSLDTISIFHSTDYGQNLSFKSSVPRAIFATEEIFYTAGKKPGSVYIVRRESCGTLNFPYTCLWIDYSSDYGATFTTYYHEFDSTYTSIQNQNTQNQLNIFPNPVSDHLIISFNETNSKFPLESSHESFASSNKNHENAVFNIYNTQGYLMLEGAIPVNGGSSQIDISIWPRGLYILRLIYKQQVHVEKIILK